VISLTSAQLRLPPPGTYAIPEPIPFRVSVTSRTSSLLAPFAPSNKDKCAIRVYVLRQVSITVNTVPLWRSYIIGEGKLTYTPPTDDVMWLRPVPKANISDRGSIASDSEKEGWASHNWTGAVKIDDTITVGGFQVGDMSVKVCLFHRHVNIVNFTEAYGSFLGFFRSLRGTSKPTSRRPSGSEARRPHPAYNRGLQWQGVANPISRITPEPRIAWLP
jgi:hypothetical protein